MAQQANPGGQSFVDAVARNPQLAAAVEAFGSALGNAGVALADPEPEQGDDSLVLVKNGFVRWRGVKADGTPGDTITLRRPTFGELREIRLALEENEDRAAATRHEAEGATLRHEAHSLRIDRRTRAIHKALGTFDQADADPDLDEAGVDKLLAELEELRAQGKAMTDEGRAAARKIRHETEEIRLEWLRSVTERLAIDDLPDDLDWPGWAADPSIVQRLMTHWRNTPLARG